MKTICIYAGASLGNNDYYYSCVYSLAAKIFEKNYKIVYGGGGLGLMGALYDCAIKNNGNILGVIPNFLIAREKSAITRENKNAAVIITNTMHERKEIMFSKADAFIALPGGVGTLEEIIEIITWKQIGIHSKPICFYNVNNFWGDLFSLFDHFVETEFIKSESEIDYFASDNITEIMEYVENYPNHRLINMA